MTESNTLLRLDSLRLRNFRCFGEFPVDLHPSLTVLVADNGMGKTATLDAIGLALDVVVSELAYKMQSKGIDRTDVRVRLHQGMQMTCVLPSEFIATGLVADTPVTWERSILHLGQQRARNTTHGTKAVKALAQHMRERADTSTPGANPQPQTLPLVAFYGTGRLWNEHRATEKKRVEWPASLGRYAAYQDCLSSASSFKMFATWYANTARDARSPAAKAYGPGERPHEHLAAVREAVRVVLGPTGWADLDWPFSPTGADGDAQTSGPLVVEHRAHGRIPVAFLSDGIRTMVGLAGDLASRCVRLNPHLGEQAARLTPGVLLIDEVDMHLHPSWQQLIVKLLQDAFPKFQMILSTHSPHVLSTVDSASIRTIAIDDQATGAAEPPQLQTRGDESGNVLARAMHVNPVPDIVPARLLSEYRGLVQRGLDRSERAQTVWRDLMAHFGEDHHLLREATVLRDLQEFKREHTESAGGSK